MKEGFTNTYTSENISIIVEIFFRILSGHVTHCRDATMTLLIIFYDKKVNKEVWFRNKYLYWFFKKESFF